MAEPDYLEGDCDELIKPKKLINPVKNSRNHQDLHRELLMNQKRSGETIQTYCFLLMNVFNFVFLFHIEIFFLLFNYYEENTYQNQFF